MKPGDHEDDDRPAVGLRAQQQPQEQRHAEQPQHRQGVGQGPDAVRQRLPVGHRRAIRPATGDGTGAAADGPFDDVTTPSSPLHTVPEASGPRRRAGRRRTGRAPGEPDRSGAAGSVRARPGAAHAGTATEAGAGS